MSLCLILIGFKACGKTSVGKLLAQKLRAQFLDTDRLVEARYYSMSYSVPTSRGLSAGSSDLAKPMGTPDKPWDVGRKKVEFGREHEYELTCPEIYRTLGAQAFRDLEKDVIIELQQTAGEPRVIATGGGVVLDSENRALLRQLGQVIYLSAPYATLLSRLKSKPLPAFMSGDLETEFQTLFAQREPIYREMADRVVNTEDYSVIEVVEQLM